MCLFPPSAFLATTLASLFLFCDPSNPTQPLSWNTGAQQQQLLESEVVCLVGVLVCSVSSVSKKKRRACDRAGIFFEDRLFGRDPSHLFSFFYPFPPFFSPFGALSILLRLFFSVLTSARTRTYKPFYLVWKVEKWAWTKSKGSPHFSSPFSFLTLFSISFHAPRDWLPGVCSLSIGLRHVFNMRSATEFGFYHTIKHKMNKNWLHC